MEEHIEVAQEKQEIKDAKSAMTWAGLFFFLLLLFEIPASFAVAFMQGIFPGNYNTLISILITQGYLFLGAIIFMVITKKRFGRDLQVKKYRISTFFLSILVLIVASPMAIWLNLLSQLFAKNQTSGAIFQVTQNVPFLLGIAIIGCLPGFIEETIYRGIMFTAFRKRSVLTGIVVSALSFGLMHLNFNQILYAVYLGVVFALVVEATGSLLSTMLLHMLFNATNTAYVYILPKLYEWLGRFYAEYSNIDMEDVFETSASTQQILPMLVAGIPFAIGGIVLMYLLLKLIASINGREFSWEYIRGNRETTSETKPVNVFLILGWIFCIAMALLNLLAE